MQRNLVSMAVTVSLILDNFVWIYPLSGAWGGVVVKALRY